MASHAIRPGLIYPAARRGNDTDTFFGTEIADPYRWMEELDTPELKTWVDAENDLTRGFLTGTPALARARAGIHARLMQLTDYERFGMPTREAGRLFFGRNTGLQNQAVLYWQPESQPDQDAEPRLLLDPNTLSADGTVALGSIAVSEDGKRIAYTLSDAGSDVQRVLVRQVETGEDLPDRLEWVKFSMLSWSRDGRGFFYSSYGPPPAEATAEAETLKRVSSFHKLYFHALGTPQSADQVVFERPDDGEMLVMGGATRDGLYVVLRSGKGHTNALAMQDLASGKVIPVAPEADALYSRVANIGSRLWLLTNKDAPNGRIVLVDLEAEHPEDQSGWQTIVAETSDSLEDATIVGETLVLSYLHDAQSRVELHALDGAHRKTVELPGIGVAHMGPGKQSETDLFFAFTNYTTPGTVYRLSEAGEVSLWRRPRLKFDPAAYETRQVFATSKDGTRVPLFVTLKRGAPLDGSAPTLLYGYGGFGVSLGPAYSSSRLLWLEMGGVYAEAILRGGGEYGEDWHQAGTKLNKQNVFDDFLASAEWLIANRYTCPEKLAINGGSNGGLLVAACALQRPELFAAAIPQVGVLDMLRFDRFTIGYAWKPDYGSPSENEEEFRAILRYSPLHNLHAGTRYPAMLITTGDHDDRVFPAHSFKFAAALQALSADDPEAAPALIRVETRAGHGAGMPLSKQLDVTADMYTFLVRVLNLEPPL